MKIFLVLLGAFGVAGMVWLVGTWYLRPFLTRQFLRRRLNQPSFFDRVLGGLFQRTNKGGVHVDELQSLAALAELLDATARNLRLGKSMTSALQNAVETCATSQIVIGELVRTTTQGELFSDATKRLVTKASTSELIFALRTLDLAATGGVGGVLALERAAVVLRERATNINDRKTQAAQAMMSTKVLSWSPVIVAGWLILTSPSVRDFLISSSGGWLCIALGVSLNYAGRRWMQNIVAPAAT